MSNMFEIFRRGASALADATLSYHDLHKTYGINPEDWKLLTTFMLWTPTEQKKIRSILTEVINISLTIAGLPAQPLPAQYVAALVSKLVSTSNRLVASTLTPETFDAVAASNLDGNQKFVNVTREQMMSLVIAYSSDRYIEPNDRVDDITQQKSIGSLTGAVK